ncbi:unnamed protein product [Soboliphyme baturini]|uniref:WD_REPEATS_REGION domain-containing protein n=1 Tax=Soboliphyme baturini TaxID=241478 RepID=A0A183IQ95_9BILA|nr:unnamed protein product [Soboliphyme baturini]
MYVCNLISQYADRSSDSQDVMCNVVRTFNGGGINSTLNRNCLFTHRTGNSIATLAAVYDEAQNRVNLWDISTGELVVAPDFTLVSEFVPDLLYCKVQETGLLNVLTKKRLCLYTIT